MLLQVDGSQHDWLEGRGPYLTLVAAIDDATGTVAGAVFREQEDAQGYFLMLREVISSKGVPWLSTAIDMASSSVPSRKRKPWRSNFPGNVSLPSSAGH